MTGDSSAKWRTRRRLALVLLAALLLVGSCSYLTGGSSSRPGHDQAQAPGKGAVTVETGPTGGGGSAGGTSAGGTSAGGTSAGGSEGDLNAPGATSGGSGSASGTPAAVPGGAHTGSSTSTNEPESGGAPVALPTPASASSSSATGTPTTTTDFSVSFSSTGKLYPGAPAEPLDLSLINPNGHAISLTSLTIGVKSITLTASPPAPGTCTPGDFQITQFSGPLPISVGAGQTVTLSALGVPASEMPKIGMVDQPYNQDGCEGAKLSFSYSGTAA